MSVTIHRAGSFGPTAQWYNFYSTTMSGTNYGHSRTSCGKSGDFRLAQGFYSHVAGVGSAFTDGVPSGTMEGWGRCYIFLESYPNATQGDGRICIGSMSNSHYGFGMCPVTVDYEGRVQVWNYGLPGSYTYTLQVESAAGVFPLNKWVRVEFHFRQNSIWNQAPPNPPYVSDAIAEVKIDGVIVAGIHFNSGPCSSFSGLHEQDQYFPVGIFGFKCGLYTENYVGTSAGGTKDTGWVGSVDDYAFSLTGWIGPGYVTQLHPSGVGSETGWGNSAAAAAIVGRPHLTENYYSQNIESTVANDIVSFTVPRLRSLGIATPSRYVELRMAGSFVYTTGAKFGLRVNGGTWEWFDVPWTNQSGEVFGAVSTQTINPDDDVEVGVIKDNTTTKRYINALALVVETLDRTEYVPPSTVAISGGSYTGNGTMQQIDLNGADPDLVILCGANGGTHSVAVYSKMLSGGWYTPIDFAGGFGSSASRSIMCVRDGYLYVSGGAGTHNENGLTFSVLLIQDASQRVFARQWMRFWGAYTRDMHWYQNSSYMPDFMLMFFMGTASIPGWWGPSNAAGKVTWGQSPYYQVSNVVDEVSPGLVRTGTGLSIGYMDQFAFLGVKNTYAVNRTVGTFSYTGNGVNGATISMPAEYSALTPIAAFVVAQSVGGVTRGQYKGPGMSSSGSRDIDGNTYRTAAMGAFGPGYISAGSDNRYINSNGVAYDALVFFEASDTFPRTDSAFPADPRDDDAQGPGPCNATWGCDWSPTRDEWSFDWPDLVPGLLGMNFGVRRFNSAGAVADQRAFKVNCEQRTFPVEAETREFDVPCEQRTFPVDQE
jgi:hypothetical protein